MSKEDSITIITVGMESVDEVKILWMALHDHHEKVAPHFGITLEHGESWKRRRANYQNWLGDQGSRMFIAKENDEPVGYALVRIVGGSETWKSGDQIAELETFSILPEYRGMGIGSRLMAEIYSFLREEGIREVGVTVVETNVQAIRFYEKHGFGKRYVYFWGDVPEVD
jgi:ribosomal protein S18 acetylase RimI-like enzyme